MKNIKDSHLEQITESNLSNFRDDATCIFGTSTTSKYKLLQIGATCSGSYYVQCKLKDNTVRPFYFVFAADAIDKYTELYNEK